MNRRKDCYNCQYIREGITRITNDGFKLERKYDNGGSLYIHESIDKKKSDYNAVKAIGRQFAKNGHSVKMTPAVHFLSQEYQNIYSALVGTQYYRKCPDLSIDGKFYEFEGFTSPWRKTKVGSMITHGLKQAPNIIINNTKGCSDRYIRKHILARQHNGTRVDEVWLYEKGNTRLLFKNGDFYKNNRGK